MDWLLEPLQFQFVRRALVLAVLIGIGAGLVGAVLYLRRTVLIADAFAHSLLPGIGLAFLLLGPGTPSLLLGAVVGGLLTAAAAGLATRRFGLREETAFGVLFVCSLSLGIALMSRVVAPTDLLHYLFGDILAAGPMDMVIVCTVTCMTILGVAVGYRSLLAETFDPVFHRAFGKAGAITHAAILLAVVLNLVAGLRAVGLILALGLFILPAVTASRWCRHFGIFLVASAAIGACGGVLGLAASWYLHLPSGACMVGCLGLICIYSVITSNRSDPIP